MQTYVFTSPSSGQMETSAGKVLWASVSSGLGQCRAHCGCSESHELKCGVGLVDDTIQEHVIFEGPTVSLL